MEVSLSNADASFTGEATGDLSGHSVAGAGDVNGDGYDDFLISAIWNDEGETSAGQTYLVLGKASGWALDTNLSQVDASFLGEFNNDNSGYSVSGAGDVNGDGYDDLLIGAGYNDEGDNQAGQTYLILGKASGWSMDTDLSNVDASFIGESAGDQSGRSVAGVGDVNGDGYDDFLIGAWYNSDGGTKSGQTYLIFGKESGWSLDTSLSTADASFWGEAAGDESGMSVSDAGDVNGDGFDDILIGAYRNDDGGDGAGQTYLILGKTSGWAMDTNLSNADASFLGENSGDEAGFSAARAGDVNDDGFDDIMIGAHLNDDGGGEAGKTYLLFGKASGWVMDTNLSKADVSYWGEDVFDHSGFSVAGAGNVNGDEYDDILISAPWSGEEGPGAVAGQTYLIFGEIDTDNDGVPDESDAFPDDVAASMDTDGDGYPDEWNQGMSGDDSTSVPELTLDEFPDDPLEWKDTDGDGHGDNGDAFPDDPLEWVDSDKDGHGDNADVFPDDPLEWTDTDGDTHGDNGDVFPEDPLEWADTDEDGHGDNGDEFPEDPLEWLDTDGDTYGDNGDAFPEDPLEWADRDEDGHGDNKDVFPNDPLEWVDTDNDTHGDNGDVFPDDPLEWADTDDDDHGDNGDAFPNDKEEWRDTDGDGVGDNGDAFPDDAAASTDTDGDGHPDGWNTGKSEDDSTTGLQLDHYPDDGERWKKEEETPSFGLVGALCAMAIASMLVKVRRR